MWLKNKNAAVYMWYASQIDMYKSGTLLLY